MLFNRLYRGLISKSGGLTVYARRTGILAGLMLLIVSFQNCGDGFKALDKSSFELASGVDVKCSPGVAAACSVANGLGTKVCNNDGNGYGVCTAESCNAGYNLLNGVCDTNLCAAGAMLACTAGNGTGMQVCKEDGQSYGACVLNACNEGYRLVDGTCVMNACVPGASVACDFPNGQGSKMCDAQGAGYGACMVVSCNSGYKVEGGKCVSNNPNGNGVPVILDTDMALDVDDAGSLGMLNALADNGEANILAVMHNTGTPKSAGIIDAINTYYGRPNVPIGAYKGDFEDHNPGPYASVADQFPNDVRNHNNVPEATVLYRKILAAQPDQSVVIISVGFLTNLANLLRSGPDASSPLNGYDLVHKKVKLLSAMAGQFPSGVEFNLQFAGVGPTSKYVIDTLNIPVVFSGFEIGLDIHTGGSLSSTPTSNPVRGSYERYFGFVRDRNSWDQTAVLYGVRGASFQGREYWKLRTGGFTQVRADGFNEWITNNVPANKKHSYLLKSMSNEELAKVINGLMSQAPKNK